MDEIAALQAALREAQAVDSVHRLSEFNCVELVNKLIKSDLLHVLFTTNGKEYLTHEQLEREVADELLTSGGRLSVVDLPQILGVDITHVENAVGSLLQKDSSTVLIEGELVAKYYLDDVVSEIAEMLKEHGVLSVPTLGKRFGFSTQFMELTLRKRLRSLTSNGHLVDGMLYTEAYVSRQNVIARGLFSAVTRPVSVSEMATRNGLRVELVMAELKRLLDSKELDGAIRGQRGGTLFVPTLFTKLQWNAIESFYRSNHFIEFAKLEKLQVQGDPKTFLKTRFTDGHTLHTVHAHKTLVDRVDAGCEDAIINASWVDVSTLLPPSFSAQDLNIVLGLARSTQGKHEGALVLQDKFVVATKYVDSRVKLLKGQATEWAKAKLAANQDEPEEDEPEQGKSQPAKSQQEEDGGEDDDDDWSTGKKKGKGKGKGKAKAKPQPKAEPKASKKKGKEKSSKGGDNNLKVDPSEIARVLKKEDAELDDELAELLADELAPQVEDMRKTALQELTAGASGPSREQRESAASTINSMFLDLQVYAKGAALLSEHDKEGVLHKHLAKHLVSDLLNALVAHQTLLCLPDPMEVTNPQQRDKAVAALPADVCDSLAAPIAKAKAKDVDGFIASFPDAAMECQVMAKLADKKLLRQQAFAMRMEISKKLQTDQCNQAGECVLASCLLLFSQVSGGMVDAPGRVIPILLAFLEDKIAPQAHESLRSLYELAVSVQQVDGDEEEDRAQRLKLNKDIEALMPKVKEMVQDKATVVSSK